MILLIKVLTGIFIIDAAIGICLVAISFLISATTKMEKMSNITYKFGMILIFIACFIFLAIGLLIGILTLQDAIQ